MGDLKSCDIHDKEPPNNIVNADTTYKIYVEQKTKNKDNRTETKALFVNGVEGVDACSNCMTSALVDRMLGIKTKPIWRRFMWEQVEKTNKKGETKQSLEKHFLDEDE